MTALVSAIAVTWTSVYLYLVARSFSHPRRKSILFGLLLAVAMIAATFLFVLPLRDRLVTLYWADVPLNLHLPAIKLCFLTVIWLVFAIILSAILRLIVLSNTGGSRDDEGIKSNGDAFIVFGFVLLSSALILWQYAHTHDPSVDLFEQLTRAKDSPTVDELTYTLLLVAAAGLSIIGLVSSVFGYFRLARIGKTSALTTGCS